MRKRRTFGAQDVMETTFSNYCMAMPTVDVNVPAIDYSNATSTTKHVKIENNTPSRAKISFSIESIIGIK